MAASSGGTSASASRQESSHAGSPSPGSAASASSSGPGGAATTSAASRDGSCQLSWGSTTICSVPASQPRRDCDTGGSPTRSTSSGRCCLGERPGTQEHVVVGHHVRAVVRPAANPRGRVGQHRPAARRGQPGHQLRHGTGGVAADDHAAPGAVQAPRQVPGVGRAGGAAQLGPGAAVRGAPPNPPRRAARPPGPAGRGAGS